MPGTAVVTDSTSDLPAELRHGNVDALVSLHVDYADGTSVLGTDIDSADFYRRLPDEPELPSTRPAGVEDFVAAYEPILADGRDIVSIHLSSGLSDTCNNARAAAKQLDEAGSGGERVTVIDSATASTALGLLVLTAVAGRDAGETPAEIAERIRSVRQSLRNYFAVNSLDQLRRGGRIGGASAWVGTRLDVKPILSIDAEIRAVERVRTSKRALERLAELAKQMKGQGATAWALSHAAAPKAAAQLAESCTEVFGTGPVFQSEVGPVIGTHVGAGTLIVASLGDQPVA